jgi:aminoglycoside phosphotransferase (APT) family kinase protein
MYPRMTRGSIPHGTVMNVDQFTGAAGKPPKLQGDVMVERCLGAAITAVRELAAPASTSYALRRLALELADGRTLDVLLKDFGVSPHPPEMALSRGARERYVYENVLASRELGTPALYGVVWDDASDRHWLLLEFVDGRKFRRDSMEDLMAAGRWISRLHKSVTGDEVKLAQSDILLAYDHAYFRHTADRAVRAVGARFGSLAARLEAAVADYESLIEKICSGRPTLVHGSYRPKNILVAASTSAVRICPADWELAAIGPPLHDLAFIADGCDRPSIRLLCQSYLDGSVASSLTGSRVDAMLEEIERLRLHKTLRSLARSAEWAYPEDTVANIVAKAEKIRHDLG